MKLKKQINILKRKKEIGPKLNFKTISPLKKNSLFASIPWVKTVTSLKNRESLFLKL